MNLIFVIKKNIESLNTNNVDIEYKLTDIKEIESLEIIFYKIKLI